MAVGKGTGVVRVAADGTGTVLPEDNSGSDFYSREVSYANNGRVRVLNVFISRRDIWGLAVNFVPVCGCHPWRGRP